MHHPLEMGLCLPYSPLICHDLCVKMKIRHTTLIIFNYQTCIDEAYTKAILMFIYIANASDR